MANYWRKIFFMLSLGIFPYLILISGGTAWGKTEKGSSHLTIIYSGNTSGFVEPSG